MSASRFEGRRAGLLRTTIVVNVVHIRRVLVALVVISVVIGAWTRARSDTSAMAGSTVQIDASQPGAMFDLGAVGLSTEAFELGSDHLNAKHDRLVRLMRLLGPSVLRIGGNSVDLSWWTSRREPPPAWATNVVTPADLTAVAGLLAVTGWRALLGVDLGHFDPARVADEARYANKILGTHLLGIEIGNEPDDFGRKPALRPPMYAVSEYLQQAEAYRRVLDAAGVDVFGPATGQTEWLTRMGAAAHMFSELTLHYYPSSTCTGLGSPSASHAIAAELLLPDVREQEEETIGALVRAGSIAARPTRIGETNAAACVTSPSAGPVFASALWALDWVLRAASHGVSGMSFHGNFSQCGPHSESPICAYTQQAAYAGDVTAQPEYYGLLAARQLEGGWFVPTRTITSGASSDLTVWATLARDRTVRVAVENLATEGAAQVVSIPTAGYIVTMQALTGPSTDASGGVSLGGVSVTGAGRWHPRSTPLHGRDSVRLVVSPASAVIVVLHPRRSHKR